MNNIIEKEVWKDIKGYEDMYQISNFGRVKSLERVVNGRWGKARIKERLMKSALSSWGYELVGLNKYGKTTTQRIHRLVAIAFLENPNNLPEVNHKDEIKTNNHVSNLEWCDPVYNANYGTLRENKRKHALKSKGLINANQTRKRKVKGTHVKTGEVIFFEYMGLARKEGFNVGCISNACSERTKTHKGYYWEYID